MLAYRVGGVARLRGAWPDFDVRRFACRFADRKIAMCSSVSRCMISISNGHNVVPSLTLSAGDPFNNRELMFHRNQMLSKNATNAVFPCCAAVLGDAVTQQRESRPIVAGFSQLSNFVPFAKVKVMRRCRARQGFKPLCIYGSEVCTRSVVLVGPGL